MNKYIAPYYNESWGKGNRTSFHCPHCQVYAQQYWSSLLRMNANVILTNFTSSTCAHCGNSAIWLNDKMIYPLVSLSPVANEDLPADCLEIYNEARGIASLSPKGAAALLRLCIQMLMPHLGQKGKNINDDIGALVKAGLPVQVQQALDVCRVIGNNAVHPGEIIFDEDNKIVNTLFGLVNFIVDNQITQPKQLDAMYGSLPEGARAGIQKRDS
ncbi:MULTISPECIES: DUF4145 domain-containing protein [unclassified Pantoea]|uniref:DUF4145 domain-containing protein n=1 Tax=unclassified Pantoea TaxID=2630326 RepID=UPI001231883D|nr:MULTISPECIES: DUF4145 domain-containing protein [unclassified Pantoea]KAA6103344.1 DUF4145 domain-containing protein [Pantoea sp. B_9]KAA6111744.1 DUF4145 domain-containing protein [Pantoea sp. B_10]